MDVILLFKYQTKTFTFLSRSVIMKLKLLTGGKYSMTASMRLRFLLLNQ
ncbi:hypothetical protein TMU3MR103_0923 [Tetragenococcus muriaticus 3MR10-3]|uniref:Uncharacterized protein n=1 Tax=Tetragenococcus muriaticus 3MR10-3 TaxID=1302648 RepID=A0A091C684_9ENTE|nr:hypothetical protein TMU3MR103_0923 [Tetragenococcus muriaticus 3MR10-3]